MKYEVTRIPLGKLSLNSGQIEGLPANPRQWTREDVNRIAASLKETPELFEMRPVIAMPHGKEYVILAGSLRYCGAKENGDKDAPVIVLPEGMPVRKLQEIVLKDNSQFGAWDMDALANEWDDLPLAAWGVPAWNPDDLPEDLEAGDTAAENIEPIPEVEEMLNKAMQDNCRECVEQIKYSLKEGWLVSGYTVGLAKAYFIKALYYKKPYPRWISYIFHPHQFLTSANKRSIFEQMEITAREGKAGIAGFRTITEDERPLTTATTTKGSYPVAGARLPMDFPAKTAENIIREFGGGGAKVLDPCHGWGGRFVGALLAGASEYVGCDPSAEAHAGLEKMRKAYLPYCKEQTRRVEFILSPYEQCEFQEGAFDLALTSPPYFDVEQYRGEGQSHTQYPQYELWREGFYRPLIANTYRWIKEGGVFALQVGSQSYPLLADGIDIAKEVGFVVEDIRPLGGGTSSNLHNNTDEDEENEKIIILRK